MIFPKPAQKPKKSPGPNAEERRHWDLVRQLNCVCCESRGRLQPCEELHHVIMGRFSQRRSSHMDVIPLCHYHHSRLHHQREKWKAQYGLDTDWLPVVDKKTAEIKENTI